MQGTSERSLREVVKRFEPVLQSADAATRDRVGSQLLDMAPMLDESGALSRALTDPSRPAKDKIALVHNLLDNRSDPRVVDVMCDLASQRWSTDKDIADAVERLGANAMVVGAQSAGTLERVESELFRIDKLFAGNRELRSALSNRMAPATTRIALAHKLFEGKVDPVTLNLLDHAIAHPRGRSITACLFELERLAAERRSRRLAEVTAAQPLTAQQIERLGAILNRFYSQEIQLNVTIDPEVLGGLRIQVDEDVYDSTTLGRLSSLRTRIAG